MTRTILMVLVAALTMGFCCLSHAQSAGSAGPVTRPPVKLPPQANPRATEVMAPQRGVAPGPAEDATSYRPIVAQPRARERDEQGPPVMRSQPLQSP